MVNYMRANILSSNFYIAESKFRFLRICRKRINSLFSVNNKLIHKELKKLIHDGFYKLENNINSETIEKWKKNYFIYQENFNPKDGNIGIPFYNEDIHNLLTNSLMKDLLFEYFKIAYNRSPILQMIPHLMIAYPTINQSDFSLQNNNFPAIFHVDYPYEFTVHIPLTDINQSTSHTKYIRGTHISFKTPNNSESYINHKDILSCFATQGDILLLDVEGWHRADLVKSSFRAIIQIKFTTGNNLLLYSNNYKLSQNNLRTIDSIKFFPLLKEKLKDDAEFIQKLRLDLDYLKILENNISFYNPFINNL